MVPVPILVVDDSPGRAALVSYVLTESGYEVLTARGALQAMAALQDYRPPLVLVDLQLPGRDGHALVRRLKADPETYDTTVVGLTTYAMADFDKQEVGCDGYLKAPLDARTLPKLIKNYLLESAARRRHDA